MNERSFDTGEQAQWAIASAGLSGIDSEVSLAENEDGSWTVRSAQSLDMLDDLAPYDAAADVANRLEIAKASAKRRVIGFADGLTDKIMSAYPKAEVASWAQQATQARRIVNDGETLGADEMLVKLADKAGVPVGDYAAAVLAKSASFEAITVEVKALRDQSEAAIDAITDVADIEPLLVNLKAQAEVAAATLGLA